jgi:hypothetical protein
VRPAPVLLVVALAGCGGDAPVTPNPMPSTAPLGCPTTTPPVEAWVHVAEGSAITWQSDPPSSGAPYPTWARYAEFDTPVARGHWVHNLEHGGIVFLYRPDIPAGTIDALRQAYRALPDDPACGHKRALLTPDPLMVQQTVVAAGIVLNSNCLDPLVVRDFVSAHRGRGPEAVCAHGTRP